MNNLSYIVNVEAAIYKDDKWLIIKRSEKEEHSPGILAMVGGKIESKSAVYGILEENLRREIMEEVGVEVSEKLHYLESNSFISDKGQIVINIIFLCEYQLGEPRCMSPDEVSGVYWMSCKDIFENSNTPIWLRESIKKSEDLKLKIGNKSSDCK